MNRLFSNKKNMKSKIRIVNKKFLINNRLFKIFKQKMKF